MTETATHAPEPAEATPRNLHYGEFYGLKSLPNDGRPLIVVHGNCQAESLRVLLDGRFGGTDGGVATVRMVPAHELTLEDVPHLQHLLGRATYLVTQPVVRGYRDLPVGTLDLLDLAPHLHHVVVPVLRWAGLHPTQAIVRSPEGEPPIVPYHDLRTVLEASTGLRPEVDSAAAVALRDQSREALRRRIEAHGALDVVDLFDEPGRRSVYVINHPTNAVLDGVVTRVADALGLGEGRDFDPGRVLLGSIVAPIDAVSAQLDGLERSYDDADDVWVVRGERVAGEAIRQAHLQWYRENPGALDAALRRHHEALEILRGARAGSGGGA